MSLILAANHLASHGRHGDTELIHMSKGEVKALRGLAQIHGGDLTINPKTGLPEAGFLSSILPTVVGIGLNAAFPGYGLAIAGGVGLATAALTGDLGQGLMAGLGAWSGGQLAGDISKMAGVDAVKDASLSGLGAENVASNAVANTNIGSSLMGGASNVVDTTGGLANLGKVGTQVTGPSLPGAFNPQGTISAQDVAQANNAAQANTLADALEKKTMQDKTLGSYFSSETNPNLARFGRGFDKVMDNPLQFVKDNPFHTLAAVYPALDYALTPKANKPPAPEDQNPFGFKKLSKDFKGTFGIRPSPYPTAQYTDYTRTPYIPGAAGGGLQTAHYANKGLVNYGLGLLNQEQKPAPITPTDPGAAYSPAYNALGLSPYEKDTELMSSDKMAQSILKQAKALGKMASRASVMMPDPAKTAMASIQSDGQTPSAKEGGLQGYALGGLSLGHLGGYSDGGRLLKGPGDGVSDSIPASIGHKQPARLAEGEFVIPARIVSELGNGSTDAGAKRLYAMMDRIKAKRAKTKNIAADTKTYNYLPA